MKLELGFTPTPEQSQAIGCLDEDASVIAGAGAGKTGVLINRILNIVLSGKANFQDIVAITFTEKAAAEMKVKLRIEAQKQSQKNPELRQKLATVSLCQVSTIHGFCNNIIRRFGLWCGYFPEFAILDENEASRLLIKSIAEVLEKEIANADKGLRSDVLARFVAGTHLLDECLEASYNTMREHGFEVVEATELSLKKLQELKGAVQSDLDCFVDLMDRAFDSLQDVAKRGNFVKETLPKWEKVKPVFFKLSNQDLAYKEKEAVLDYLDEILLLSSFSKAFSDIENEVKGVARTIPYLFLEEDVKALNIEFATLLEKIEKRYFELKAEVGGLDFNDLQKIAYEVIKNPVVKEKLSAEFQYIMIDEYQDTNFLQQRIVDELWQDSINLFIVGDPKQSIYRFRGAEVELFEETTQRIVQQGGKRIHLAHNFRSSKSLIDFYNGFFSGFMPGDKKKPYAIGYEEALTLKKETERSVHLLAHHFEEPTKNRISPHKWQAKAIVRKINEKVQKGAGYGDFAVLFPTRSAGLKDLEEELSQNGIPFTGLSQSFYSRREIRECLAFLEFLNNPTDQIVFAATLKGPFFDLNDKEIHEIFKFSAENDFGNAYTAVLCYGGDSILVKKELAKFGIDQPKGDRFRYLAEKLIRCRDGYGYLPLDEVLRQQIEISQYNLVLLYQVMGQERLANVEKLLTLISDKVQIGKSNNEIVDLLRLQRQKDTLDAEVILETDERVRVMTIHAAKGLEFRYVILAGMLSRGMPQRNPFFTFDKDEGFLVSIPNYLPDLERYVDCADPRFRRYMEKMQDEDIYEKQRLFYVAATRAKEKLYLVFAGKIMTRTGTVNNPVVEMFTWDLEQNRISFKDLAWNFTDFEYCEYAVEKPDTKLPIDLSDVALPSKYRALSPSALTSFGLCPRLFYLEQRMKIPQDGLFEQIPFDNELSRVKGFEAEESPSASYSPTANLAHVGTVLHEIFAKCKTLDCAEKLLGENDIEEYLPQVKNYFSSDFFLKPGIYEMPFTLYLPEQRIRFIGSIDKVIEEADQILVVDFKTRLKGDFKLKAQDYSLQLAVYGTALEKSFDKPIKAFIYFPHPNEIYEIDLKSAKRELDYVLKDINYMLDKDAPPEIIDSCFSGCKYLSICRGHRER